MNAKNVIRCHLGRKLSERATRHKIGCLTSILLGYKNSLKTLVTSVLNLMYTSFLYETSRLYLITIRVTVGSFCFNSYLMNLDSFCLPPRHILGVKHLNQFRILGPKYHTLKELPQISKLIYKSIDKQVLAVWLCPLTYFCPNICATTYPATLKHLPNTHTSLRVA